MFLFLQYTLTFGERRGYALYMLVVAWLGPSSNGLSPSVNGLDLRAGSSL